MVVVGRNNLTVFEPTSIGSVTYIHTYFIGSSPRGFSESIKRFGERGSVADNFPTGSPGSRVPSLM